MWGEFIFQELLEYLMSPPAVTNECGRRQTIVCRHIVSKANIFRSTAAFKQPDQRKCERPTLWAGLWGAFNGQTLRVMDARGFGVGYIHRHNNCQTHRMFLIPALAVVQLPLSFVSAWSQRHLLTTHSVARPCPPAIEARHKSVPPSPRRPDRLAG